VEDHGHSAACLAGGTGHARRWQVLGRIVVEFDDLAKVDRRVLDPLVLAELQIGRMEMAQSLAESILSSATHQRSINGSRS
jgi:hypothetical protein